ncbi:hypothetical protein [uncultured Psychromonas sp.]|uniref:hypothetical protein n=1 Tax=uncultured Psychromonas sp. TaxID=173974 RepID=UPI0026322935|nr:hypothetical protein [uncultured Psychromonas sp.]
MKYLPPLSISFIWHPLNKDVVQPILDFLQSNLARNKDNPFSRKLNIPLFFYSSQSTNTVPNSFPNINSSINITFVFTSQQTIGVPSWKTYIENSPVTDSTLIVPIAIDSFGLRHGGNIVGINCIRLGDFEALSPEQAVMSVAISMIHEITRRLSCSGDLSEKVGSESSLKLFLSHCKVGNTGVSYATALKRYIDNSNMTRFFDVNEISPGFSFESEISKHIALSTLVILETDEYSSRYWCQREVLLAKQLSRPIIVVNCLESFEDRIFPASSNVPSLHVEASPDLSLDDVLRVLITALLESLRCTYAHKKLEGFKFASWIPSESLILARPPEMQQVLELKSEEKKIDKICYPEPPMYEEETSWLAYFNMEAFTPLWRKDDNNIFENFSIGISISDPAYDCGVTDHINPDSLTHLSQDLARHLLARSASIIYGGDLRDNGFTQFILDEARILQERLKQVVCPVKNFLAWPLHLDSKLIIQFRAKYGDAITLVECIAPEGVDAENFLPPNTPDNLLHWSRSLTQMRQDSIRESGVRICAGGKFSNFKGKMPGVLEEIMLTLDSDKPLYLLGGFGGVVGEVSDVLLNKQKMEKLSQIWIQDNQAGYSELQSLAKAKNEHYDSLRVEKTLLSLDITLLSSKAGLTVTEYCQLMVTPFVDECVHLVMKGIKNLK